MYRCNECGLEFNIKPDFCDCGNNIFEEIISNQKNNDTNIKNFKKKYRNNYNYTKNIDPISIIIFLCCIILSIIILFFINPVEKKTTKKIENTPKREKKVADINSFWDSTAPTPIKENSEEKVNKIIVSPKNNVTTKKAPPKTNKTVQKETKKVAQKPTTTKKTIAINPKSTTQNNTISTQNSISQDTKTTQEKTKTDQNITQMQITINSEIIKLQMEKEFSTYKSGLRNTLFSKINFANIYGDGHCIVAFNIDYTGKLINKSFSKQSANNMLNDEVYKAIMATPKYNVPPKIYKGEVLHFSVKFKKGQYEVTLY